MFPKFAVTTSVPQILMFLYWQNRCGGRACTQNSLSLSLLVDNKDAGAWQATRFFYISSSFLFISMKWCSFLVDNFPFFFFLSICRSYASLVYINTLTSNSVTAFSFGVNNNSNKADLQLFSTGWDQLTWNSFWLWPHRAFQSVVVSSSTK